MTEEVPVVSAALAALGLPADADVEPAAGGASGSAWRVSVGGTTSVLRSLGSATAAGSRVAAMMAARDEGLPAPALLRRAPTPAGEVALLSWLPGVPLLEVLARAPGQTRHYGERMGRLHRRLHEIRALNAVIRAADDTGHPFGAGRVVAGLPSGDRLLHLDWHPLNLLVDEALGEIVGIVDWDNARAGDPSLDLARTRSILTLEPGLADLPETVRHRLPELLDAWADGYGDEARAISPAADTWARLVMLADLEPRYADRPNALDHIRESTADAAAGR
ncbi:MAG TPA: phosphotransferase [Candidatus Limnocylindria bacterium]|nr:phosphotransferase [Candidatus Limnocylindria bacterium]